MNVPFVALQRRNEALQGEYDDAYRRVMGSGNFILGSELELFESEFATYCGARYCIGVGSGLDALTLTLRGSGIGEGDEVIVPAHTFIATWLAVSATGALPVPVDIDADTYNIDPVSVESAINARTRAIIAVHLYGQPAAMEELRTLATEYQLRLIEDAAQAHGALYKQEKAGSLGDAAAFSFYPTKNLGCFGDGGAIVTSDTKLAERIRLLRNYGSSAKYVHEIQGVNSRLDELQAAFLRIGLRHLDNWNEIRRRHAASYLELIDNPALTKPFVPDWALPVWHLFVLRSAERDRDAAALTRSGVMSMIHYPHTPHRQHAYADLHVEPDAFPAAETACAEVLSLPLDPYLNDDEIAYVAQVVSALPAGRA